MTGAMEVRGVEIGAQSFECQSQWHSDSRLDGGRNYDALKVAKLPRHAICDAHEWNNEIPNVPIRQFQC